MVLYLHSFIAAATVLSAGLCYPLVLVVGYLRLTIVIVVSIVLLRDIFKLLIRCDDLGCHHWWCCVRFVLAVLISVTLLHSLLLTIAYINRALKLVDMSFFPLFFV